MLHYNWWGRDHSTAPPPTVILNAILTFLSPLCSCFQLQLWGEDVEGSCRGESSTSALAGGTARNHDMLRYWESNTGLSKYKESVKQWTVVKDFLTIGTWRWLVVRFTHRPHLPPGLSWYSFLRLSRPQGTWNCQIPRKKSPATPGIDPGTCRLVAQCLDHYHNGLWYSIKISAK